MHDLSRLLLSWYDLNKRSLPWRDDPRPYYVWLSEIILQQTRVAQGLDYFHRFVETFPRVEDLASADEDTILKLWQGLGYYNRARNLHKAAKQVVEEFDSRFPETYYELIQLKGVGPYTASAIASIAFNEPKAVVDGHVIRVIARLKGVTEPVDTTAIQRLIQTHADELINTDRPGDHNQAMMELGALVCTPRNPSCLECPLRDHCVAFEMGSVERIPMKSKKIKRRSRYFHYLVADVAGKVAIRQRGNQDIWSGLFEFPMIESETDEVLDLSTFEAAFHLNDTQLVEVNQAPKHVLSHQDLHAHFYHVRTSDISGDGIRIIESAELHRFALPRLIDRYLEKYHGQ